MHTTPGLRQPLVSGDGNQVLVIDAAARDELVRLRREALDAMVLKLPKPDHPPNGGASDSGNSAEAAQP